MARTTKKKTKKTTRKTTKKTTTRAVKNATQFLSDVQNDKCFWVNNGWILRNLPEVPLVLSNMSDDTFFYHVNENKNDFYNWIGDVIGDKTLAKNIKNSSKASMIKKVERRITQLKR